MGSMSVTQHFKFPDDRLLLDDKKSDLIRLTNTDVSSLPISKGIPLNISFKPKRTYKNNDDTRFDEHRYDEIRLIVKNEAGE
jgi:hypothetical protein